MDDARIKELDAGVNRFGAKTMSTCPRCHIPVECSSELHLCMCEHFTCPECDAKWEEHPVKIPDGLWAGEMP